MWYDCLMRSKLQQELAEAQSAADHARKTREFHRGYSSKDSIQRRKDVDIARAKLRDAMGPIRSRLHSAQYHFVSEKDTEQLREASYKLQRERRKLHKMLPKDNS